MLGKKVVTILDWDDTLFPTSWICEKNLVEKEPTSDEWSEIQQFENTVLSFLSTVRKNSDEVHIVTNAREGWIDLSSKRFMPRVHALDLPKVSAQSKYNFLPPICWKFAAFGDVLRNKKVTLVCSIGDSLSERRALVQNVRYLSRSDCIIWGKSIKLIERPNLAQLAKQLELVENALPYMFGKEEHEDLMMTMELLQEL